MPREKDGVMILTAKKMACLECGNTAHFDPKFQVGPGLDPSMRCYVCGACKTRNYVVLMRGVTGGAEQGVF